MVGLVIVGSAGAVLVLYAADRVRKARARAQWLRTMSDRLDAAAARAEKQHEQRQAAAQTREALTSVMPAIKHPPLNLPGGPSRGRRGRPGPVASAPDAGITDPGAPVARPPRPASRPAPRTGQDGDELPGRPEGSPAG